MRRFSFVAGLALLALVLAPVAAHAVIILPKVDNQKWTVNVMNLEAFVVHDGNVPMAGGGFVPANTVEMIGIAQLSSPLSAQGTVVMPSPFHAPGGTPVADDVTIPTGSGGSDEALALLYDLELYTVWDEATQAFQNPLVAIAAGLGIDDVLFLQALGRNPLAVASAVPGSGGVFEMYSEGEDPDFQIQPSQNAPSGWTFSGTPGVTRDTYTSTTSQGDIGITADTLIVDAVFQNLLNSGIATFNSPAAGAVPMPGTAVLAFRVTSPFGVAGTGLASTMDIYGNLDVLGGPQAGSIIAGGMAVENDAHAVVGSTDIRIDSQSREFGAPGSVALVGGAIPANAVWDVTTRDPAEWVSTPEPASCAVWGLLVASVAGVMWIRRKRAR